MHINDAPFGSGNIERAFVFLTRVYSRAYSSRGFKRCIYYIFLFLLSISKVIKKISFLISFSQKLIFRIFNLLPIEFGLKLFSFLGRLDLSKEVRRKKKKKKKALRNVVEKWWRMERKVAGPGFEDFKRVTRERIDNITESERERGRREWGRGRSIRRYRDHRTVAPYALCISMLCSASLDLSRAEPTDFGPLLRLCFLLIFPIDREFFLKVLKF